MIILKRDMEKLKGKLKHLKVTVIQHNSLVRTLLKFPVNN